MAIRLPPTAKLLPVFLHIPTDQVQVIEVRRLQQDLPAVVPFQSLQGGRRRPEGLDRRLPLPRLPAAAVCDIFGGAAHIGLPLALDMQGDQPDKGRKGRTAGGSAVRADRAPRIDAAGRSGWRNGRDAWSG